MFDDDSPRTAWSTDPERVDPDDYHASAPYAKQMTWAPCSACDLQVHAPATYVVYHGLRCPKCDAELLPPPSDPEDWTQRLFREEDELSEQLA